MTPRTLRLPAAALALACVVLAGCQSPLDRAWGRSQREHVARSIANPEAGQDARAVPSDGSSTDNALQKHREAEKKAESEEAGRSVININAGN